MATKELNLGILAHVDAGKTTLTERLLYAGGAIDQLGSVDAGTTQTDSLTLERQRGITIRSAVASFAEGDVHVNLIDTPGHPDFIAEVERVLSVLDGAVLVVSAVEGVQPQTRILMRALKRLCVPTLVFVNKIDRVGAEDEPVVTAIRQRLAIRAVSMGRVYRLGTGSAQFAKSTANDADFRNRLIEVLADRDEAIMAAYVDDAATLSYEMLRRVLAAHTTQALVHPVFFGSAATGAGVDSLLSGITELLPSAEGDPAGPPSATVFKIERGANGERIAYVRMFTGTIGVRETVRFGAGREGKVTAISVFERGGTEQRPTVSAGAVGKVWGLADIRVGDRIGEGASDAMEQHFPPPMLETAIVTGTSDDRARLRVALAQLAEQDPLINVRQDDRRDEISVSLYGEVQKEVIQATLANDFKLDVAFRETTPIYVERPTVSAEAIEILHADSNPFLATIGLRIEPALAGAGVDFRLNVAARKVPLYLYKTIGQFSERMEQYVRNTLHEGSYGWEVTDCTVTMTDCAYSVPDGPPSRRGPLSTAADFRKLTPLVLMQALQRAKTVVCEPVVRATIEIPTASVGNVIAALARLGSTAVAPSGHGATSRIVAVLPATRADDLQRELPALSGGEGVLDSTFAGHEPVGGSPPPRRANARPSRGEASAPR